MGNTGSFHKKKAETPPSKVKHNKVKPPSSTGDFDQDEKKQNDTFHRIEFRPAISIIIDLGSDGLAVSYVVNDQILIQDSWKSKKYRDNITQKTAILIDSDGKVNQFGRDAIDMYLKLHTKQNDWMLFREFVTDLYGM